MWGLIGWQPLAAGGAHKPPASSGQLAADSEYDITQTLHDYLSSPEAVECDDNKHLLLTKKQFWASRPESGAQRLLSGLNGWLFNV